MWLTTIFFFVVFPDFYENKRYMGLQYVQAIFKKSFGSIGFFFRFSEKKIMHRAYLCLGKALKNFQIDLFIGWREKNDKPLDPFQNPASVISWGQLSLK